MAETVTLDTTMAQAPQDRTRLLMAVAAVLSVVVVVYYAYSFFSSASQELNAEIELKEAQYGKLTRTINNGGQLQELNKVLTRYRQELVDKRFVTGSTMPLAEARLQTLVKDMATKSNLNVTSSRILPLTVEGDLTFLNLLVNARGEIHAIRDFILAIQESPQLVFLRELEIKQISSREKRFYYINVRLAALSKT